MVNDPELLVVTDNVKTDAAGKVDTLELDAEYIVETVADEVADTTAVVVAAFADVETIKTEESPVLDTEFVFIA